MVNSFANCYLISYNKTKTRTYFNILRHTTRTMGLASKYNKLQAFKVRLRWFGAVLQYICKHVFFLSSVNVSILVTYHEIAKGECNMMIQIM